MELSTAIRLIRKGVEQTGEPQTWADLGAGRGLFTNALANCLATGSIVYALDKDDAALRTVTLSANQIHLQKIITDVTSGMAGLNELDGVLMANVLHYIRDKTTFLKQLTKSLKQSGRIVLVEYDTEVSNRWVPYPLSFEALQKRMHTSGFNDPVKLDEEPSIYNQASMYAALITMK